MEGLEMKAFFEDTSELGINLHPDDKRYVLNAYINRFTKDHKPKWAYLTRKNGKKYKPQFASDTDWLKNTRFAVRKNGRLDHRCRSCYSTPTWPEGI